jgi:uncharacterized membrane protein YfcA
MAPEFSWLTLALVLAIFFVGGVVKGALGFGLPLLTMSVLPLLVPVQLALAINAVVLPCANFSQFVGARLAGPTFARFWPVIVGVVTGVPLGVLFLKAMDERAVLLLLGSLVVGVSAMTFAAPRLRIPARLERRAGIGVGVAAGVVGALTTANGPVFVMYLVGLGIERRLFVSALGLLFVISGVLIAGSFATIGVLDLDRLLLALVCLAPALVGMWGGNRFGRRMSSERFRTVILGALVLLGANLVWRALAG